MGSYSFVVFFVDVTCWSKNLAVRAWESQLLINRESRAAESSGYESDSDSGVKLMSRLPTRTPTPGI